MDCLKCEHRQGTAISLQQLQLSAFEPLRSRSYSRTNTTEARSLAFDRTHPELSTSAFLLPKPRNRAGHHSVYRVQKAMAANYGTMATKARVGWLEHQLHSKTKRMPAPASLERMPARHHLKRMPQPIRKIWKIRMMNNYTSMHIHFSVQSPGQDQQRPGSS